MRINIIGDGVMDVDFPPAISFKMDFRTHVMGLDDVDSNNYSLFKGTVQQDGSGQN